MPILSMPVSSSVVIAAGDLVFANGVQAAPASDFAWMGTLAATREAFAAEFLGVAMDASAAGETADIRIQVGPETEYERETVLVISGPNFITPAETVLALSNTKLEATPTAAEAIGIATHAGAAGANLAAARFASAYYPGSSNVNAQVG